jgi:hypothetical protein
MFRAWLACALFVGCTGSAQAQPRDDHDRPVPPEEPRAELSLELDLPPSQECEERFDLALYQDRRVELVEWDEQSGDCTGRRVVVRYLSAKITREQLIEQVTKLSQRATVAKTSGKPGAKK